MKLLLVRISAVVKKFLKLKILIPVITVTVLIGGFILWNVLNPTPTMVTTAVAETKKPTQTKTPTKTPTSTPTPTTTPEPAPVDGETPTRPQPAPPAGVEAAAPDAPATPSVYAPPPSFSYMPARMVNITAADIPAWIAFDVNNDNEMNGETEETWNSSLYAYYNNKFGFTYQYQPIEFHAHWWGDPATSPSHDAIVNYMDNKDALTVNFVVSANRVTSMIPLTWMATTTGYRNPWAWKMEIDPRLGDSVYKTVGALMYIVESKNPHLKNEPIRLHKEFYPTGCSEIDVNYLRAWVNKFASGEYDINTGQPKPAPAPVTPPVTPEPAPTVTETPAP